MKSQMYLIIGGKATAVTLIKKCKSGYSKAVDNRGRKIAAPSHLFKEVACKGEPIVDTYAVLERLQRA